MGGNGLPFHLPFTHQCLKAVRKFNSDIVPVQSGVRGTLSSSGGFRSGVEMSGRQSAAGRGETKSRFTIEQRYLSRHAVIVLKIHERPKAPRTWAGCSSSKDARDTDFPLGLAFGFILLTPILRYVPGTIRN